MRGHFGRFAGVLPVVVLALFLVGCPKRPMVAQAPAPTPPPPPAVYQLNNNLKPIHFAFDKSNILPEDAKILDASAAWLKANPNQLVRIQGYADPRGTDAYNLTLSERRAKAAQAYLVSKGVEASRISTEAHGEEGLACKETTETCYAQDRRVVFLTKPR